MDGGSDGDGGRRNDQGAAGRALLIAEFERSLLRGDEGAGSDSAARVAETQCSVSVTIVLAELARLVGELRNELRGRRGAAVGALLKTIHDCARGLRWSLLSEPAARSPASLLSTR